jgi:hypothetical protein
MMLDTLLGMAKPHRNELGASGDAESGESTAALIRAGRLRPATRRLADVLAERGPLTGPVTDAGTRALMAVRGEASDSERGAN